MAEITQTVPLYKQMSFNNLLAPISVERRRAHYIYSGMSFTADLREGLQWPTIAESAKTTFDLSITAPETGAIEADLILVAPRVLYDGGVRLAESEILQNHLEQPAATLNRETAAKLGLTEGDSVMLTSAQGSLTLPVKLSRLLPAQVVRVPRNLPGAPAEQLLNGNGLAKGNGVAVAVTLTKETVQEPA
jgi:predicted molibdopterin-dependent oxidoreductase YjgC